MIVEGFQILELAVSGGWNVRQVFYSLPKLTKHNHKLLARMEANGSSNIAVSPKVLEHLSKREGPLGCVALVSIEDRYTLETIPLGVKPLVMVTEGVEKPGNLGVVARSASAAGADALVIADGKTEVFDPACIHASLGSVFSLPIVNTSTVEAAAWLKRNSITSYATTPQADELYHQFDLTQPSAIIVGNEHRGLSDHWLDNSKPVRIRMVGTMNSLNASVAAAILLFEAVRQRHP